MLKKIIVILNVLFALGLILVHFTARINPLDFWPFAFLGLGYPILLIVCLLFLFSWLFTKTKLLSLVSLVAIIICWESNMSSFQISTNAQTLNEVELITWNVKNFDLYNWSGNVDSKNDMFALLKDNRPNILCLQEFYTENKGDLNNLKQLKNELDYKYHYFAETYAPDSKRHWGLVIFTDYKILDTGKLTFVEGTRLNSCMYVDIALSETQKARVYNLHLQSNQFSQEDYDFLGTLSEQTDKKPIMQIANKLRKGYVNRAKQTLQVLESKNESPYPTIICGDFNDTPISFAYKTLSDNMKDAYIEKGFGFGKTFQNPTPFLRIDYGLFHPLFNINSYNTIPKNLSDHYPVLISFSY